MTFLERIGVELPVVQAGMGGGLSRHELAAAVSEAGGLGTIAVNGADAIRRELDAARLLTGRPLAVNLLLPFARREWFEAAAGADVVVTFWGRPKRRTAGIWMHQCGSVGEAQALDAGAVAAVAGTRFLASEESRAHPDYRRRLLGARETILTELFGTGWPAPHRVIANAATERWLVGDPRGPRFNRALNRLSGPGARYMPARLQGRIARAQRPGSRLLSPLGPTDDGPANLLDAGPLYAGETVARISDVRPAAQLVRALS